MIRSRHRIAAAPACRRSQPSLRERLCASITEPGQASPAQVSETGTNLLLTEAAIGLAIFSDDLDHLPQNASGFHQGSHV